MTDSAAIRGQGAVSNPGTRQYVAAEEMAPAAPETVTRPEKLRK